MTDDCDALIFRAHRKATSITANLSGNKNNLALNSAEKIDNLHTMVYKAADLEKSSQAEETSRQQKRSGPAILNKGHILTEPLFIVTSSVSVSSSLCNVNQ